MTLRARFAALALAAALLPEAALAQPVLAPVWTDHAVVQRDRPIVVEGASEPDAAIELSLGTQTQSIRA